MSKRYLWAIFFSLASLTMWAQSDTIVVSYDNSILNGEKIKDYTNKWKVTYLDAAGKETPNKIWTDYGQIIELDGKKYFHRVQDLYDPQMNLQDTWINMTEHKTLIPVSFSTMNSKGGFLYYQFDGGKITGSTNQVTQGEITKINVELDHKIYDWNLYGMLLIGLPLKEGLIAKFPFYSAQSDNLKWLTASVIKKESIMVLDEMIQTWKVRTDQKLTFWLSEIAPYVIKLELQLQNNTKLIWEII